MADDAAISTDVPLPLVLPELGPGLGLYSAFRTRVHVPEATVHENDGTVPRQHDVGRAGQVAAVKAEAEAEAVQDAADDQFGLRVPAPNARHHAAELQ